MEAILETILEVILEALEIILEAILDPILEMENVENINLMVNTSIRNSDVTLTPLDDRWS